MSDEVKTYNRGGRLAFCADKLAGHIGETWTLSCWVRLGDGAVEGHTVSFYHFQSSGIGIAKEVTRTDITSEWTYVEVTGPVVDRGTRGTGAVYDGTSETYFDPSYGTSGTTFSFGEMYFYDRTGAQKYDVCLVSLQPADIAGGCSHEH